MTFTFDINIPQPGDTLDDSQNDLLQNNISLNGIFSRNHLPLITKGNTQGRHTFVEMTNSSGLPNPTGGLQDNSGTIYTKRSSSVSDVYYSNDNSTNQYQITNVVKTSDNNRFAYFGTNTSLVASPVSGKGSGGWVFLPGGLLLQYGVISIPTLSIDVGFTQSGCKFPLTFSNVPYNMQVSYSDTITGTITNATVRSSSLTTSGFDLEGKISNTGAFTYNVNWLAIGSY